MGLLHTIAESPCGLAELCERTGLPRATAHRLAAGLEVHRLLARDAKGAGGSGLRWSSWRARSTIPCWPRARPCCRGCARSPVSVQLYRREGVADLRGGTGTACGTEGYGAGRHSPMTAGSGARSCWHTATPPRSRRCCRRPSSPTVRWPKCASGLGTKRRRTRAGGGECFRAVRDGRGQVIAAVSVSGPIDRMGRRPGARWAADLLAAADALTRRL